MQYYAFFTFLLIGSLFTGLSQAYFRISCSMSQTSRIDPIASPGGLSGHVHIFAGKGAVDPIMLWRRLIASQELRISTPSQLMNPSYKLPAARVRFRTTSLPTGLHCCTTSILTAYSKRSPITVWQSITWAAVATKL